MPRTAASPNAPLVDGRFLRPRDPAQRKYEMLRAHFVSGVSVTEAAQMFGCSRQTFYVVAEAYRTGGISALVPRKRGPKAAHKLTPELIQYLAARRAQPEQPSCRELVADVARRYQVRLHPGTIQRLLKARAPKGA